MAKVFENGECRSGAVFFETAININYRYSNFFTSGLARI